MNEKQRAILAPIIEQLKVLYALVSTLSDPLEFGFKDYDIPKALKLPGAIEALKEMFSTLDALRKACKEDREVPQIVDAILFAASKSLKATLNHLYKQALTLVEELQGKEGEQAYTTLTQLCKGTAKIMNDEIVALSMLLPGIPKLKIPKNKTMMISLGELSFSIDKIVVGKQEFSFDFKVYSIANALSQIYMQYGIQTVTLPNAEELSVAERTAIINAILNILQIGRDALGTVINAIIPVREGDPFYARFLLATDGTITAFFEGYALPPLGIHYASLPAAKKTLQEVFQIAEFAEDGATWTLEELNQVGYALNKLQGRKADLTALRGCKFVRVVAGKQDSDESREGGSYTFANHTLKLTNAAFELNRKTFCGHNQLRCPASASVILHEVGHVIEFADWRALEAQLDGGLEATDLEIISLTSDIEFLQKQIKELEKQEEAQFRMHMEELEALKSLAQEADTAVSRRIQAARRAQDLLSAGIEAYNKLVQAIPEKGPISIMNAIEAYAGALQGVVKTLKAINVNSVTAPSVEDARKAFALALQAQSTVQQNPQIAKEVYAQVGHDALGTLEKALNAFVELYKYTQLAAEANSAYEKRNQQADEQNKAATRDLAKQREPLEARLKEQDAHLSRAKSERSELQMKKAALDEEQLFEKVGSPRLKKFVQFVTENEILPITKYAQNTWKMKNYHEFFAEAYHLFFNDPDFLQQASGLLYTWFLKEAYLK